MKKPFSFPKSKRLRKFQQIKSLFQNGKRVHFYPLSFCYKKNEETQVLVRVSKKVGNAVTRNLLKRRIREAVRLSHFFLLKIDCAISIKNEKLKNKKIRFSTIQNAIQKFILFQQKQNS